MRGFAGDKQREVCEKEINVTEKQKERGTGSATGIVILNRVIRTGRTER